MIATTTKQEIETPALLVDMPRLESNLERMASFFRAVPAKLRPHFKNHKCPALATRQLAAGAIGITCATLREAECLVEHGGRSILIANEITDAGKIRRLVELASRADVMVSVDNAKNLDDLARAAPDRRTELSVLVDVDVGLRRCGVPPGEPAVRLAQAVIAKGLRFRALMGYEGGVVRQRPPVERARQPKWCRIRWLRQRRNCGEPVGKVWERLNRYRQVRSSRSASSATHLHCSGASLIFSFSFRAARAKDTRWALPSGENCSRTNS